MKPLRINLLPPRPVPWWAVGVTIVLLLAALGSVAAAGWRWHELQGVKAALRELERQRAEAADQAQQRAMPAMAAASAPAYDADARKAWNEAVFATSDALTALEAVALPGITPLSLELQADTHMARLELEYQDQALLLKYLELLNEGESDPRWRLLRAGMRSGPGGSGLALLESSW